jgi:hypothetical protein
VTHNPNFSEVADNFYLNNEGDEVGITERKKTTMRSTGK